jgi:hypothetical protein
LSKVFPALWFSSSLCAVLCLRICTFCTILVSLEWNHFFFFWWWVWTQGLILEAGARQALYHLSHSSSQCWVFSR